MDMALIGTAIAVVALLVALYVLIWTSVRSVRLDLLDQAARLHERGLAAVRMQIVTANEKRRDADIILRDGVDQCAKDGENLKTQFIALDTAVKIMQGIQERQVPGRVDSAYEDAGRGLQRDSVQGILAAQHTQINSMRRQMTEATVAGRGPEVTPSVPKPEGAMFESGYGTVPSPPEDEHDASAAP